MKRLLITLAVILLALYVVTYLWGRAQFPALFAR